MSAPDRRQRSTGSALLGLLAVAVIAGVMLTVGVAPAIALTGIGAKNAINMFQNLPAGVAISKLQQKTTLYAKSHGKDVAIASFFNQDREVLTLDQVGQAAQDATIAGEDQRFKEHGAVDPVGILRALVKNSGNGGQQGASTITQQYVKNICIQKAELHATEAEVQKAYADCTLASPARKIREARLAIGLEKRYSKDQILLGYLNIAPFGGNVYGIQAAAKRYFSVDAKDLTKTQAAALLAIVNEPNYYRLDDASHLAETKGRRDYILDTMLKLGTISQAEHDRERPLPIKPKLKSVLSGCQAAKKSSAIFCDYISHVLQQNKAFGTTAAQRSLNLMSSGWKVYTTLNLDLQKKAQKTVNTYVPLRPSAGDIAGAATTIEAGTGRIISMVQSKKYGVRKTKSGKPDTGYTVMNFNTDTAYGGSAGFQPGSTFKMFTLVNWLQKGHGLYDVVNGNPRTIPASDFTHCKKPDSGDPWSFRNDASREDHFQSVMDGTKDSVNGVFASMAQQLDLCQIRTTAESLGMHPANGKKMDDVPPFVIGQASAFAPMTVAAAYAAMGANGKYCKPVGIDTVVTASGTRLPVPAKQCRQAVTKPVAIAANAALHGVITGGTMSGDITDGSFAIGKTGTTDNANDTWAVGSTSKTATAVWTGGVSRRFNLRAVLNFPSCRGWGQAANARHCIWHDIMAENNAVYEPATSGEQPASQFLHGAEVDVPDVTGESIGSAKADLERKGFASKVGDKVPSDDVEPGKVAATDPGPGDSVAVGTTIVLHPSSGKAPAVAQGPQAGTVPDVRGKLFKDAVNDLAAAGLQAQPTFTNVTNTCQVAAMNPQPGTQVAKGSGVQVFVAGDQGLCTR